MSADEALSTLLCKRPRCGSKSQVLSVRHFGVVFTFSVDCVKGLIPILATCRSVTWSVMIDRFGARRAERAIFEEFGLLGT